MLKNHTAGKNPPVARKEEIPMHIPTGINSSLFWFQEGRTSEEWTQGDKF